MDPIFSWARRTSDGKSVHVSEVPQGLECDCVCSKCNGRLVAKKGYVNRHHFAHMELKDCMYQGEYELHRRSKEILAEALTIRTRTGTHTFEKASVDARIGRYIVDVFLQSPELNLAVDIFVSSRINSHKPRDFGRDPNIRAIVIDLSRVGINVSPMELLDILTNRPGFQRSSGDRPRSSGSATPEDLPFSLEALQRNQAKTVKRPSALDDPADWNIPAWDRPSYMRKQ